MSADQPLALRLADWIESPTFGRTRPEGDMHRAIAAELRRDGHRAVGSDGDGRGQQQRAARLAAPRGARLALAMCDDVAAAIEAIGRARLDAMVVPAVVSTWNQARTRSESVSPGLPLRSAHTA